MVRSASAFLALILLPGALQAQQAQETHRVVKGETLWGLAQHYYSDPYKWPRIYEANRAGIKDPHWIYPGQDLAIPDVAATTTATATTQVVQQVTVEPAAPAGAPVPESRPIEAGEPEHTIFFPRPATEALEVTASLERSRFAVPRVVSYSAPWLSAAGGESDHLGTITEFSGAEDEHVPRTTALPYDKLELAITGPTPARGTELLAFRAVRNILGVGKVMMPTGVLTVSDPVPGGAVALVVDVFDRLSVGDMVMVLPTFSLQPGARPVPATTGADASIVGFANDHPLEEINDVAFLDQGSDHGVRVGDEYVAVWVEGTGTPPELEGRLQVISVHPDHSSARIVWMKNPIFQSGVRVRVDRKMP